MRRKPQDPRHHGLKKPEKVLSREGSIHLADLDRLEKVPLQTLIDAWNKALRDIESQGQRVTEGPHFNSSSYYGRGVRLTYTYEWDNIRYESEQALYQELVYNYEEELRTWNVAEKEQRRNPKAPNLEQQILRAEHRLANLKAHQAGTPIPYPEG